MTKLHYQVMQALLPVLLDNTKRMREKFTPASEIDLDEVKMVKLIKFLKEKANRNLNVNAWGEICEFLSLASGNPLYNKAFKASRGGLDENRPAYDPLTVILIGKNGSGHGYKIEKPYIVTHGLHGLLLFDDGHMGHWAYNSNDNPRIASDEEVEACLSNLSTEQVKTILTNDLFAAPLSAIFEEQGEEPDPSVATEDGTKASEGEA